MTMSMSKRGKMGGKIGGKAKVPKGFAINREALERALANRAAKRQRKMQEETARAIKEIRAGTIHDCDLFRNADGTCFVCGLR